METEAIAVTTHTNPNRIVVGVDGSPNSQLALRWAARVAAPLACTIEAIAAWQYPVLTPWEYGILQPLPDVGEPEKYAQEMLDSTIDAVFPEGRPTGFVAHTVQGQAASVLIDASAEATMLIVGPRGHGGFAGLLLGSVSSAVTAHAKCPVLVVHGG